MESVILKAYVHAPAEKIWDILGVHENYTLLKDVVYAKLLREGENERNGVGAIREVHVQSTKFIEEITVYEPPRRVDYLVTKCNHPMKHHGGRVDLIPRGDGTEIHWVTSFSVPIPLIGRMFAKIYRMVVRDIFYDNLLHMKAELED